MDKHRKEHLVFVLAAVAVLLGATAFARMANFYVERGRMQGMASLGRGESDPNGLKQCLGEAKKAADALKEKNLFVVQPPKEHPIKQVDGIFGNEALIAGKWYKAGEKVGDATILAIKPTVVKVSWDGKEMTFTPFGAAAPAAAAPPSPPAAKPPTKEEAPAAPKPAAVETVKVEAPAPVDDDPFAWMGVKLSPRVRAKLLEMWNNMPEEQKQKAKDDWNNMSDADKQKAVDSMEQNM